MYLVISLNHRRLQTRTKNILLTISSCVLQHSLCCSWIYWRNPLPSHPAKKSWLSKHGESWSLNWGRQRHWQSHLLAGVPIESRPLQDKPETLPLLGDEDAAFFSLLPQPAVTVGLAQLAARHTASAHGRCLSCKAPNVSIGKQWWFYRGRQFTEVQNKCAVA